MEQKRHASLSMSPKIVWYCCVHVYLCVCVCACVWLIGRDVYIVISFFFSFAVYVPIYS